jgi:hypothetical protein
VASEAAVPIPMDERLGQSEEMTSHPKLYDALPGPLTYTGGVHEALSNDIYDDIDPKGITCYISMSHLAFVTLVQ